MSFGPDEAAKPVVKSAGRNVVTRHPQACCTYAMTDEKASHRYHQGGPHTMSLRFGSDIGALDVRFVPNSDVGLLVFDHPNF
jgi:hypothetical protein